jgi:hypothetical protein
VHFEDGEDKASDDSEEHSDTEDDISVNSDGLMFNMVDMQIELENFMKEMSPF